jgi:hypothetical protein
MKTSIIKQAILTATFLACISLSYGQKKPASTTPAETIRTIEVESYASDTTGATRIWFKKGGQQYSMKLVDEVVTEFMIDGKKVAAENMHLYNELIDSMKEQLKKDRVQAEEDRRQAALDRIQAEKDRAQANRYRDQANKDRQEVKELRTRADKDRERVEIDRKQVTTDRDQANRDRVLAEKEREHAVRDRVQAETDRKRAQEDRALIESMLETAVKDGLITNTDEVTRFELSSEGFWINEKKQTDSIHQKYKLAYLKKPGSKFIFSRNRSGSQLSIIHL